MADPTAAIANSIAAKDFNKFRPHGKVVLAMLIKLVLDEGVEPLRHNYVTKLGSLQRPHHCAFLGLPSGWSQVRSSQSPQESNRVTCSARSSRLVALLFRFLQARFVDSFRLADNPVRKNRI